MSKVKQYIEQATNERIRSRGLIRKVAIEAARIQRDETRRQAIEVYKQMCPSKNCKGCVQAGYINRKHNRHDATGIVHGLDYLLTD